MIPIALAILSLLAAPPARQDFALENGIRVTVVHAPGAPREAIFTILPIGLLTDDARRAQHSHLLEHALIRSTDPLALAADGFLLNGETQGTTLRLETIAEPARWREALTRHARWLTVRVFDPVMIEREKTSAAGELDTTVPLGHTQKWALAAFAQVVRHGLPHAAVRGDLASATAGDMQSSAAAHVGPSPRVRIVLVGPVAPKDVRETLEAGIGKLPAMPALALAAPVSPVKPAPPGDRAATWDLAARHYLEWYPLPDDGPADRVAGALLATAITQSLMTSARGAPGTAIASAEAVPGMGRLLFVSASLPAGADPAALRARVRGAIDGLAAPAPGMPDLAARLRMAAAEISELPDFAALRKARAGQPGIEFLEANVCLGLVGFEEGTGLIGSEEMAAAFSKLTPERLAAIVRESLGEKNRSTLLLEPPSR